MFKKLIISAAAAGLLLVSAGGAFATDENQGGISLDISNLGTVINTIITSANTGYNGLTAVDGSLENSSLTTGIATANTNVQTQLNWNEFKTCGCSLGLSGVDSLSLELSNEGNVFNTINTSANTGYNGATGDEVDNVRLTTGNAGAGSVVVSVVNTNKF